MWSDYIYTACTKWHVRAYSSWYLEPFLVSINEHRLHFCPTICGWTTQSRIETSSAIFSCRMKYKLLTSRFGRSWQEPPLNGAEAPEQMLLEGLPAFSIPFLFQSARQSPHPNHAQLFGSVVRREKALFRFLDVTHRELTVLCNFVAV